MHFFAGVGTVPTIICNNTSSELNISLQHLCINGTINCQQLCNGTVDSPDSSGHNGTLCLGITVSAWFSKHIGICGSKYACIVCGILACVRKIKCILHNSFCKLWSPGTVPAVICNNTSSEVNASSLQQLCNVTVECPGENGTLCLGIACNNI